GALRLQQRRRPVEGAALRVLIPPGIERRRNAEQTCRYPRGEGKQMRKVLGLSALAAAAIGLVVATAGAAPDPDTRVSVGSPPSPFSQNKQNEPALAVDANHPNVLAAGSNDNIDMEACNAGNDTTCPFTPDVGGSGVYFSF